MNKSKRDRYILRASIHTLQIEVPHAITITDTFNDSVKITNKADGSGCIIINPNRLYGDVMDFEDFKNIFSIILDKLEVTDFRVTRCDLRFDSYDSEHYKDFAKLNRYLISMMAIAYNVKNCYRGSNLWNDEQISCAIKNPYFQLEHYDRNHKNFITSNLVEIATSRLEERSVKKSFDSYSEAVHSQYLIIEREFLSHWRIRWEKALVCMESVQDRYNLELVKLWNREKTKKKEIRFESICEFVRHYQHMIFCRKQLVDLLMKLGYSEEKSITAANNWKKRYRFEWFNKEDIIYAINEIQRASDEFFLGHEWVN